MPKIEQVWNTNLQGYAAGKVCMQMNREREAMARCTVERLIRRLGLRGEKRGKVVRTKPHAVIGFTCALMTIAQSLALRFVAKVDARSMLSHRSCAHYSLVGNWENEAIRVHWLMLRSCTFQALRMHYILHAVHINS